MFLQSQILRLGVLPRGTVDVTIYQFLRETAFGRYCCINEEVKIYVTSLKTKTKERKKKDLIYKGKA